jgi:hypothetical protein
MRYFCTYFDRNYVSRALALYDSLTACQENFQLFMLCMDEEAASAINRLSLPRVRVTRLPELEEANPALLKTKNQRSTIEYYYTCGPSYLLYVLLRYPEVDLLTYLDADLFFFSSPEPIFQELGDNSVGVIEHRFKRESLKRLCYDRVEGSRFADQKYLDEFPRLFNGVRVIHHPGANLAPWNLSSHSISNHADAVLVDGRPLIFFHFHGFKMIKSWLFDTNTKEYRGRANKVVRHRVFGAYIRELKRLQGCAFLQGSLMEASRAESRGYGFLMTVARRAAQILLGLLRNSYIVDWTALRS